MRAPTLLLGAALALAATPALADKALLVGIDSYKDAALSFSLPGASAADVARMKGVLTGSLGYADADIRVLKDGQATRAAILDGLTSWLGSSRPGERVFFYFAGHGHFTKGPGGKPMDTLVPFDAVVKQGSSLDNMLAQTDIDAAVAALKGRSVTMVVDASHSGRVTRAIKVEAAGGNPAARTPALGGLTRSIVVEPAIAEAASAPPPPPPPPPAGGGDLAVWNAVSPTQLALIDEDDPSAYHGVFTAAFADGIAKGLADKNHDGTISNQELLDYVREQSSAYCTRHAARCEMGLTPTLAGEGAPLKVAAHVAAAGAPPPPPPAPFESVATGKTTPDTILNALGATLSPDVRLEQFPPSPVKLGATNIHFRVTSPQDGFLILLMVSDEGEVIQLFPNAISDKQAKDGRIRAGSPITVPDASYGISFDATSVTKGTVLALVAVDPLKLSRSFVTRSIQVVPQDEVNATLLPELADALAKPVAVDPAKQNIKAVGRSVATLPYEITP